MVFNGLPRIALIGKILKVMIYGAYIVIFIEHMQILYRKRSRTWSYGYSLLTSVLLFALVTVHTVVDLVRTVDIYSTFLETPNMQEFVSKQFSAFNGRFQSATFNAITILSDLFLVYRCFIVWGSSYLVALLPSLLLLGDIGLAVWVTTSYMRVQSGGKTAATVESLRSKYYFFIVTLVENLLCTILIAYKIWSIQRHAAPFVMYNASRSQQKLSNVIVIVVESAAIYSSILIAMIIAGSSGSHLLFVLFNIAVPVNGMVFSSITVRSAKARAPNGVGYSTQHNIVSSLRFEGPMDGETTSGGNASGTE